MTEAQKNSTRTTLAHILAMKVEAFKNHYVTGEGPVEGYGVQLVDVGADSPTLGKSICMNSDTYTPIQYSDAVGDIVQRLDGAGLTLADVRLLDNGRKIAIRMESDEKLVLGIQTENGYGKKLSSPKPDLGKFCITIIASHDGSTPVRLSFSLKRLSCANVKPILFVDMKELEALSSSVTVRHTTNGTSILAEKKFHDQVGKAWDAVEASLNIYQRMMDTPFDFVNKQKKEALALIAKVTINETAQERILTYAQSGRGQNGTRTMWSLYNGVTQYFTDKNEKAKNPIDGEVRNLKSITKFAEAMLATV